MAGELLEVEEKKLKEQEEDWRPGREFTCETNVFHPSSVSTLAISGSTYVVKTSFTYYEKGHTDSIIKTNAIGKAWLLNHLCWKDERITKSLRELIKADPKGKHIRGLVRTEVNTIMPKKDTPTTFDGWMEWLKTIPDTPLIGANWAFRPTGRIGEVQNRAPEEPTMFVHVEGYENICMTMYGRRYDSCNGDIPVPLSVLRNGVGPTMDYIYDRARDYLHFSQGDPDYENAEEETGDSDGLEIEDHNVEDVIRALIRQDEMARNNNE